MTYEVFRYIFIGAAILAGVMFVVSVIVFFLLKIPAVIGDLTGANARKAIEDIRSHNERTGDKTYKTSPVNRERGKVTDKISPSGQLIRNPSHSLHGAIETEKLKKQDPNLREGVSETTVLTGELTGGAETTVLTGELIGGAETTVLTGELTGGAETTVLTHGEAVDETTVLDARPSDTFVIEYEITYIHTNEIIV